MLNDVDNGGGCAETAAGVAKRPPESGGSVKKVVTKLSQFP